MLNKLVKLYSVDLGMTKFQKEKELTTKKERCKNKVDVAKERLSNNIKEELGTNKWTKQCGIKYKELEKNDKWLNIWRNSKDKYKDLLEKELIKNENSIRNLNEKAFNDYNLIQEHESNTTRILGIKTNSTTKDIIIVNCKDRDRKLLKSIILNGLMVCGEKYRFFTASAGQTRVEKIQIIKEDLWIKHQKTLMCGLTIDYMNKSSEHGMNINKFLAYLSLNGSASGIWEGFDISKCIVVPDMERLVKGTVKFIDTKHTINEEYEETDAETKEVIKKTRTVYDLPIEIKEMEIPIPSTDGFGLMLPTFNTKNAMVRCPWIKGLLGVFDFIKFCETERIVDDESKRYKVTDIYEKEHDLLEEDVQIIFTKSQFKAWKYYKDWEEYKSYFKEFGCTACKVSEEEDEFNDARLNYQMWQTLTDITDDEIEYFTSNIKERVVKAHSNMDTMLNILGADEENKYKNYFQKALEMYPEMLQESYSKQKLSDDLKSFKKEAKSGKLDTINSKYTFIVPDPYAFCEWLLNKEEQPKGLLKRGQVSCKLFKSKNLVCERSPHLSREHYCAENVIDDKDIKKWYKTDALYISTDDLITLLLLCDEDGDRSLVISDDKYFDICKRNMEGIYPAYYEMNKAGAIEINEENVYNSLVTAYKYSDIAKYSNCLTNIWNRNDEINVETMNTINKICCLNNFAIDSAKTLTLPRATKELEDLIDNKFKRNPYFFKFAKDKKGTQVYKMNNSTMNRIVKNIETMSRKTSYVFSKEFGKFDSSLLLNDKNIKINEVVENMELIEIYKEIQLRQQKRKFNPNDINLKLFYDIELDAFEQFILEKEMTMEHAVDILVKYLYCKDKKIKEKEISKNLLWNMFGEYLIKALDKNIKKPLGSKYIMCSECGARVKKQSNSQKKCKSCAKK